MSVTAHDLCHLFPMMNMYELKLIGTCLLPEAEQAPSQLGPKLAHQSILQTD